MKMRRRTFGRRFAHHTIALLACAALLFFAGGGSLLHHHTTGNDTACHICQTLHLPALTTSAQSVVAGPEFFGRCTFQAQHVSFKDSFSPHHASRAPPAIES